MGEWLKNFLWNKEEARRVQPPVWNERAGEKIERKHLSLNKYLAISPLQIAFKAWNWKYIQAEITQPKSAPAHQQLSLRTCSIMLFHRNTSLMRQVLLSSFYKWVHWDAESLDKFAQSHMVIKWQCRASNSDQNLTPPQPWVFQDTELCWINWTRHTDPHLQAPRASRCHFSWGLSPEPIYPFLILPYYNWEKSWFQAAFTKIPRAGENE